MDHIHSGTQVVVTCDTGVAEHEAAEAAFVNGVDFLITDHHALPPALPDAPAVVNPQRLAPGHPLRDLPGVGVAFMLVQALYDLAGRSAEARQFLDLVALGIVADVATQRLDTRYLLQRGIDALRVPQRIGLQAIFRAAQVDPSNMSSDLIGFQVGPRLNALGRLDDATMAVELLTTRNTLLADQIAAQLEVLNNQRKQIEDQIYGAAQAEIAKDPSLLNFEALALAGPHWHPGVIGIVAARLVEQYRRPTVLLSARPGEPARGSARSVPGVDIGACIAACADILLSHGGHPGAAGLSLQPDLIPQFRRRLSNAVRDTRDPDAVEGQRVDAIATLGEMTLELTHELDRLAPFGAGNPPAVLMAPHVRLVSHAAFGANNKHRRLTVEDASDQRQVITWWRGAEHPLPGDVFDMLVIPRINDYRGRLSLQLEWVDSRPIPGVTVAPGARWKLVDLRAEADPVAVLGAVDGYTVWAESVAPESLPFDPARVNTRHAPQESPALVIWTTPPGPQEIEQMLEETMARTVYVVAADAPDDSPKIFLQRLAGLVKYALRAYGGEVTAAQLAAATGQREFTVRLGLDWLAARGQIAVEWLDGERARLREGDGAADESALGPLQDSLAALLAEAAAFRAYFRRANLETFFER
jgi:single-stranded-DNA-specific exonuclease